MSPSDTPDDLFRTIPELLERWAGRAPDAAAILAAGRPSLTYARLHETVRFACGQLRKMGAGQKDRIAIVLPNGPEMAAAFLAVSSCAVSAPLNPAFGADEFEFYLSDLKASAVIVEAGSDSPAVRIAESHGLPVLELASTSGEPAGSFTLSYQPFGESGPAASPEAEDVALVLHTSGTTSRPKMVPLTHENLCISARNIARWFSLDASDRCLNLMPLFHIHGLLAAVLSSLSAGACVACTPGFDATKCFEWVRQFLPTWYTAVPTMHGAILARAEHHKDIVSDHTLRFVRSCSSALSPSLMSRLEETFRVPVVESYGMTEASHQIASNPLPPRKRKAGSVGLAAGPEVAIMDAQGNLLRQGQKGEIVVRGRTIARGYEGNSEANQRAFTDGWFRTGDEGYFDDEGYLFINGRIKEIINRGGEKISPREVDEVLLRNPLVSQAVTFSVPHAQLGEDVGAAVVLQAGATASESDLRRYASKHLAHFKVPRIIRVLEEIPKGATGKIQRVGMSERLGLQPIDDLAVPRAEYRAPRTPLQRELLRIWSEVLAREDIGIDDNFFAAGGDSILATSLVLRAARETRSRLSLVDFMDAPTIAGMADRIEADQCKDQAEDGPQILVAVQPHGASRPLFCVPDLDGGLFGFYNLSRRLGQDQPVYAFAGAGSAGLSEAHSIEEMAAACIGVLRASHFLGPYLLLGSCFGGFVAYEMARQLSNSGEEIALLILLDCYNHGWTRNLSYRSLFAHRVSHALTRSRFHATKLRQLGLRQGLSYLRSRAAMFRQAWRHHMLQQLYNWCVRCGQPIPRIARDMRYARRWAECGYRRQPYHGTVTLFRSTDPAAGVYPAPLMGWEQLIRGPVDVHDIPGEHVRMLSEPAIDSVAQILRLRLGAAASRCASAAPAGS